MERLNAGPGFVCIRILYPIGNNEATLQGPRGGCSRTGGGIRSGATIYIWPRICFHLREEAEDVAEMEDVDEQQRPNQRRSILEKIRRRLKASREHDRVICSAIRNQEIDEHDSFPVSRNHVDNLKARLRIREQTFEDERKKLLDQSNQLQNQHEHI